MRAWILAVALALPVSGQQRAGSAQVDITPQGPTRLSGYGSRRAETAIVAQPLKATALAVGEPPVVVIAVDNCGVSAAVREQVAAGLAARVGLAEPSLTIAASHTHSAPMLTGVLENLFSMDIPAAHRARIEAYTERLVRELVEVGARAVEARGPRRLSFARGRADFAANRRTAGGPTDHDVEVLAAHDDEGALRTLVVNYACHCTTLGALDQVCGDWAGYAREAIEAAHPGAHCLVTVGCGADQNPAPRGSLEQARRHGEQLAAAAERGLAAGRRPITAAPDASRVELELALAPLPDRAGWEARAGQGGAVGYHALKNLARLDAGEALPTSVPYPVQVLRFGDDLAWVFLPGEVVVDYSLRLKHELDASRLIVSAYANDMPGYVPSERVLREGGYEGGGAMVYYDLPGPYTAGLEQRIVDAVRAQVPPGLVRALPGDRTRSDGFAPLAAAQAASAIEVRDGLRVVLAAAEPLVVDPVAIDWGADGSLWVVEMRDYPNPGEGVPRGRVKRLIDDDGDRVYDRASVFLDDLPLPTDVKVWGRGVLVCAAPDVLYAEDIDGDGVADEVVTKLTGFATHNHQARVNSLRWGGEGWLYAANGLFGGTITSEQGASLELGGQDFRWRPATGELEHATGLSQQGRCRDDAGRWFGCDNGNLVWHYPLDAALIAGAPVLVPPPTRVSLVGGELFPIAPDVRLLLRPDAGGAGRVTSACGISAYRDTALGEDLAGDLFVCEPVHNLVRRVELAPRGSVALTGSRAPDEQESEFLASRDPWFRPVQTRTGPDGALWVVDMARYVIEHPNFVSAEVLARTDTRAGEELGRIWRVVRDDDPLRARRENGVTRDLAEQTGARTTTPAVGPGALTLDGSADPYERFVVLARALGDLNGLSRDQVLALREDPSFLVAAHRRIHDAGGVKAATAELIDTAADWQRLGMELSDSAALPFVGILGCELAFLEGERDLVRRLLLPTGVPDLRRAVLERALQVAAFRDLVEEARAWLPPADLALLEPVAVVPAPTPDEVQAERRRLDGVAALFGNASRGRAHFEAKCATCHRLDDVGEVVGSDLAALTDTSTDVLLTALLEPSRDLYPQFQDYALRTTDGRVFGGMFQDEGPSFVRLRGVDGQVHTAARSEIDALVATGRSFMPAGLVADLTPQEVADLLAFVRAPRTPPKQLPGNEPAPVRRDAHGQWHMTASAAAVYGPELIYEQPTRNLGYWHSAQDHATWQVLVPEEVTVDVWVEFACADSSAGGTWLLEGAGQVLRGEVPGTGPDWSRYVRARVGRLTLPAGEQRFVCRAEEDPPRSLLDLRRFSFVPPGEEPGDE